MVNVLTFNRGLSLAVSKELLSDVTELRNALSKTYPWDEDVADRLSKLARIAKTAQLRGVQRSLLTAVQGAKKLVKEPTDAILNETVSLIQALLTHLQEAVSDHKNMPMRLARPIQQLNIALGQPTSSMLAAEMFLPFVPEDVAAARPTENTPEDFIEAVKTYRATYQAALIKLIKENDMTQIAAMRQALLTLEPKNPHMGYRVFFAAALAVFDSLLKAPQIDNATKWIVGKIDPELGSMLQGSTKVSEDLLSTMLYVVGKADEDTGARTRKLQEQYNLKSYLTDLNAVDPAIIDKFLAVLVKARELWTTKYDLAYMQKITGDLKAKSSFLHNPGFTITIDALHEVIEAVAAAKLEISPDELSLEGASSLLVLEQQLREGSNLDSANLSASRLFKLIGKDVDVGLVQKVNAAASILHQLASELQDDLTQLEPRLLDMLNDHTDGEADFRAGLIKIYKILRVFGKGNALSEAFMLFEKKLVVPKNAEHKSALANRYTQLGSLVENLKTSQKNAMSAAQKWLDSYVDEDTTVDAVAENIDIPNDKEMLEIFLEEAEGIIADLGKWTKSLRADPSEHDTLVNARRGFHTLKGSGRMVGLSRFGDLSYIGELLLNNWVANKQLATPEFLNFVEDLTARAAKHIHDFQTIGSCAVEYDDLESRAVALGGTLLEDAPQSKKAKSSKANAKAVNTIPKVVTPPAEHTPISFDMPAAASINASPIEFEAPAPASAATKEIELDLPSPSPVFVEEVKMIEVVELAVEKKEDKSVKPVVEELSFDVTPSLQVKTVVSVMPSLEPLVIEAHHSVELAPHSSSVEPIATSIIEKITNIEIDTPASPISLGDSINKVKNTVEATVKVESVPKKKVRETPAAWKKAEERKSGTVSSAKEVVKVMPAKPIIVQKIEKKEVSIPVNMVSTEAVKGKSFISSIVDWFKGLLDNKK